MYWFKNEDTELFLPDPKGVSASTLNPHLKTKLYFVFGARYFATTVKRKQRLKVGVIVKFFL